MKRQYAVQTYFEHAQLKVHILQRSYAWLDTEIHDSRPSIATLEHRQSPGVVWSNGFIGEDQLAQQLDKDGFGQYLLRLLKELGSP